LINLKREKQAFSLFGKYYSFDSQWVVIKNGAILEIAPQKWRNKMELRHNTKKVAQ